MPLYQELFNWLLEIPQTLAEFGNWLNTPIYDPYINISPLGLLGIGGISFIIALIIIHVIKLFI